MKYIKNWKSFLSEEVDEASFQYKQSLNPNIWSNEDSIRPEIRRNLLQIANDFFESLEIPPVKIHDIILTGSLANYNWSEYSDVDLHIVFDFFEVDENQELVKDYFNTKRMNWNKAHNIMIRDHEVEVYLQDASDSHISTGIYSLIRDKWVAKPSIESFDVEWDNVRHKVKSFVEKIDEVETLVNQGLHEEAYSLADSIKGKISKYRKCGLEHGGAMSEENLAFKMLRRSEDLKRLSVLKVDAYDKLLSLDERLMVENFIINEPVDLSALKSVMPSVENIVKDFYKTPPFQMKGEPEIYGIFLHGSYATKDYGRTHEHKPGDIDLLVVGNFDGEVSQQEYDNFADFYKEHGKLDVYIPHFDEHFEIDINLENVEDPRSAKNFGTSIG